MFWFHDDDFVDNGDDENGDKANMLIKWKSLTD